MDIAAESAYPTPFATSPLLPLLLLSLATQRNAPTPATTFKEEYDYVIVGAGSAGSTLASRLSEEPCVSVLLLEAGTGNIPLVNDIPSIGRNFWFTNLDWQYKTVPQKHTGTALINRQLVWPSGKGLGGSSLLNGMLAIRGNRQNYDDWAAQGATGWSFNDVWPYFLKLEDNRDPEYLQNGHHGIGGLLTIKRPRYHSEIKDQILETAQQMGHEIVDSNAFRQTGFHEFQCNVRNGQRCSTTKAYLVPAEDRPNLDILTDAHVKKVLFHKNKAKGVRFYFKNATCEVRARREVILSAGATNSAQILMLSGIGPKEHLRKFKIPVVSDLPVGNNFHDHLASSVTFQLDSDISAAGEEKLQNLQNIQEYIDYRTGPLASAEFISSIAFLNSRPVSFDVDFPDYQLYLLEVSAKGFERQLGLKPEIYKAAYGSYENSSLVGCINQPLQPKSRGTVRLKSANPHDGPAIDPNYLENPEDLRVMVEGMIKCQRILTSEPLRRIGARPLETLFPGCERFYKHEFSYFSCVVKAVSMTLSHPVGTAKMGDPKDPTTVVDPLLRVKGIEGLRVVDASIMPIVPSGNTNIPVIMVAEKAADIIKQTIRCPNYEIPL